MARGMSNLYLSTGPPLVFRRQVRTAETTAIRKGRLTHATSVALGRTSPVLSAAIAILSFRFLGNKLTAADAFAIVATFQSMRLPLIMLPMAMGVRQLDVVWTFSHVFFTAPCHLTHQTSVV